MAEPPPEGVPVPIHFPPPLLKADSIVSIIGVEEKEDPAQNAEGRQEQRNGSWLRVEDQRNFGHPESSGSTPPGHARMRVSQGRLGGLLDNDMNAEAHDSSSTASGSSGSDSDVGGRGRTGRSNWSKEDDAALVAFVEKNGLAQWARAGRALGRTGKQCRNRWSNTLEPGLKDVEWTNEEERRLVQFHRQFGCKWATLSRHMPGRSANSIKNHWYNTIKCKRTSKRERCRVLRDYVVGLGIAVDGGHVAQGEHGLVAGTLPFRHLEKSQSFGSPNLWPAHPSAEELKPNRSCPALPHLDQQGVVSPMLLPPQVAVPITGRMFPQREEPLGKRQKLEGMTSWEDHKGFLQGGYLLRRQGGSLGWIKRWAATHPNESAPELKLQQGSVAVPVRKSPGFEPSDEELFQLLGLDKGEDLAKPATVAKSAQGFGFGPLSLGRPAAPVSAPSSFGLSPGDATREWKRSFRNQLEELALQNQPVRPSGLLGSVMGHRSMPNLARDDSLSGGPSSPLRTSSHSGNRAPIQKAVFANGVNSTDKEGAFAALVRSISDGKVILQENSVIDKLGLNGGEEDGNLNLIGLVSSHVRTLLDEQAEYLRQTGEPSTDLGENHFTRLRDQNLQIRTAVSFLSTLAGIPDLCSSSDLNGLSARLTTKLLPGIEEETTLSSVMSSVMQTDALCDIEPGTLNPLQALSGIEPGTLCPVKPALSDLNQGPLGMLPLGEAPVTAPDARFRFGSQPTWAKMDGPGMSGGEDVSLLPGDIERLLNQGLELPALSAVSEEVPLQYGPVTPVPEWERPFAHCTIDWPDEGGRKATEECAGAGGIPLEALLDVPSTDVSFLDNGFPGLGNS